MYYMDVLNFSLKKIYKMKELQHMALEIITKIKFLKILNITYVFTYVRFLWDTQYRFLIVRIIGQLKYL